MIDYLTNVKPLEDAGKTDIEIAEILGYFTATPISSNDARVFLLNDNLWSNSPTGWSGSLQNAFIDETLSASDKKSLDRLWSDVFGGVNDTCRTTMQLRKNGNALSFQPALPLGKALVLREAKGHLTTQNVIDFYDLGDGRPWANTVEQDIIDARVNYLAEQAQQTAIDQLNQEWATAQNEGGINATLAIGDRAALVVALRAAADAIEGV